MNLASSCQHFAFFVTWEGYFIRYFNVSTMTVNCRLGGHGIALDESVLHLPSNTVELLCDILAIPLQAFRFSMFERARRQFELTNGQFQHERLCCCYLTRRRPLTNKVDIYLISLLCFGHAWNCENFGFSVILVVFHFGIILFKLIISSWHEILNKKVNLYRYCALELK